MKSILFVGASKGSKTFGYIFYHVYMNLHWLWNTKVKWFFFMHVLLILTLYGCRQVHLPTSQTRIMKTWLRNVQNFCKDLKVTNLKLLSPLCSHPSFFLTPALCLRRDSPLLKGTSPRNFFQINVCFQRSPAHRGRGCWCSVPNFGHISQASPPLKEPTCWGKEEKYIRYMLTLSKERHSWTTSSPTPSLVEWCYRMGLSGQGELKMPNRL